MENMIILIDEGNEKTAVLQSLLIIEAAASLFIFFENIIKNLIKSSFQTFLNNLEDHTFKVRLPLFFLIVFLVSAIGSASTHRFTFTSLVMFRSTESSSESIVS